MAKQMKTMDGNGAASWVSYAFTEVAGIYPITPSSTMAEQVDEWSAHGRKNIFGQTVKVVEMQSEGGAAGTMHGSLASGALTTSYTASQGLLLMIPNMYKMAGELLPGVLHVSARAVASQALSIFGDHSDVMACRQTGFAMLATASVQEVMDIGAVAHLAAIKSRIPFLHFFDGFRTSSEMQKIECLDYEDLNRIVDHDAIAEFRKNALNPEHPVLRGTAQNPDIFFQAREASNKFYDAVPAIVEGYLDEINKLTGRDYKLFNYYGAPDADRVIIAMGSVCDTLLEVVDHLLAQGEKVGVVNVHLYRPFSIQHFLKAIPSTAKKLAVLDRTKEPGAIGDPLYLDVVAAFAGKADAPQIFAGRYGLGSKDVTPAQLVAVYDNLKAWQPKNHFTIGIKDDVTHTSLDAGEEIDVTPEGTTSCKLWGLGADGTVGANKNSIMIIGETTDFYTQAYFSYDSKKSGGITQSHLRFGKSPIHSPYLVKVADFVACHNQSYVDKYDMVQDLKPGGTFLLNTMWSPAELNEKLPAAMRRYIAKNDIKLYTIDATHIARELGLGNRTNTVLQASFFALTNIIPLDEAVKHMKQAIQDTYGNKGEKVVNMNNAAVDRGADGFVNVDVPADWANAVDAPVIDDPSIPNFVKNVVRPIFAQKGDSLPVSTFNGREDGTFPQGTAEYEKRGIAVDVPEWIPETCIQCNLCSYVCPHATIRPFLLTEEEASKAPENYRTLKAIGKGLEDYQYRMQLTSLDCTGCGNCADICPAPKGKALVMKPLESQLSEMDNWYFSLKLSHKENPSDPEKSVKASQFEQPLLEFSGACIGCGETPYTKLITQLYGDRMYIANATGCSSIWGASAPSTPYTTNHEGKGPAWANSLFEDNAEYGYGMYLGQQAVRDRLKQKTEELIASECDFSELKAAAQKWIDTFKIGKANKVATKEYVAALDSATDCKASNLVKEILAEKDFLVKKSVWMFGGDGWAYDIGFGGLDHVIASGDDVNLLVLDTEVYSNTGGQASKASPTAAVAKFAAAGKRVRKKDLGMICASYGYVYVAQIAMGADYNQTLKAIAEAEAFDGPSVIIAYAPCIAHGINMGETQLKSKQAVEAGYWHLWRFNPDLEKEGKNPFMLDSKAPVGSFQDFLKSEVRYTSLKQTFPEVADSLFEAAEEDAKKRYESYVRMARD